MDRSAPTRHYLTLDGLRGIAAIAVVAFHAVEYFGRFFPGSAYLAVDFFFVLSGFVIAHAYDNKLGRGLTGPAFFRKRVARLFPLYLAGSAIHALAVGAALLAGHDDMGWTTGTFLICVLLGAVMLPSPVTADFFPFNDPSWSLFFEFLANAVYATGIWRRGHLLLIPAIAATGLAAEAVICGTMDNGAAWDSPWWSGLAWGGLRVAYSFPVGILLYRYRNALIFPRIGLTPLAILLSVLLWTDLHGYARVAFDLGFVLLVSPVIVVLGCRADPPTPRQAAICGFLGSISYPIYVLHKPMMTVINGVIGHVLHGPVKAEWQPWSGLALIIFMGAVAAVADKIDVGLRRGWLTRRAVVTG